MVRALLTDGRRRPTEVPEGLARAHRFAFWRHLPASKLSRNYTQISDARSRYDPGTWGLRSLCI